MDIDRALVLLSILKYMADDCDNESIVVEDSVRSNFFNYLDSQAQNSVFKAIFNFWAENLPMLQNTDTNKTNMLKCALLETFRAWIKLRLPEVVF